METAMANAGPLSLSEVGAFAGSNRGARLVVCFCGIPLDLNVRTFWGFTVPAIDMPIHPRDKVLDVLRYPVIYVAGINHFGDFQDVYAFRSRNGPFIENLIYRASIADDLATVRRIITQFVGTYPSVRAAALDGALRGKSATIARYIFAIDGVHSPTVGERMKFVSNAAVLGRADLIDAAEYIPDEAREPIQQVDGMVSIYSFRGNLEYTVTRVDCPRADLAANLEEIIMFLEFRRPTTKPFTADITTQKLKSFTREYLAPIRGKMRLSPSPPPCNDVPPLVLSPPPAEISRRKYSARQRFIADISGYSLANISPARSTYPDSPKPI